MLTFGTMDYSTQKGQMLPTLRLGFHSADFPALFLGFKGVFRFQVLVFR